MASPSQTPNFTGTAVFVTSNWQGLATLGLFPSPATNHVIFTGPFVNRA